jgi:BirA family biotin operon repressor/biotin-[acetyl-CoA-carboxylase] ligase
VLSKEKILKGLQTKYIGRKIFVFESLDSTNVCAKTLAEADTEDGTVVVADYQTEGRGRLGRRWEAQPGTSLLLSTVLRPSLMSESAGLLTFYAAVSVARALEHETGLSVECKWPNDLLLNRRKVSGILIESSFSQQGLAFSVAGIGLNVRRGSFPEALETKATSLERETGKKMDRTKLLCRLLTEMDDLYADVRSRRFDRILDEWNSRCTMFGKDITVLQHDHEVNGSAVGLSSEGGLILQTAKGKETVFAGDVTVLS